MAAYLPVLDYGGDSDEDEGPAPAPAPTLVVASSAAADDAVAIMTGLGGLGLKANLLGSASQVVSGPWDTAPAKSPEPAAPPQAPSGAGAGAGAAPKAPPPKKAAIRKKHGPSPAQLKKKAEEEAGRRVKAEVAATSVRARTTAVLAAVDHLLEVGADDFEDLRNIACCMTQDELLGACEERAVAGLCGNMVCFNELKPSGRKGGRYRISTKEAKVYEREEEDWFCCITCNVKMQTFVRELPVEVPMEVVAATARQATKGSLRPTPNAPAQSKAGAAGKGEGWHTQGLGARPGNVAAQGQGVTTMKAEIVERPGGGPTHPPSAEEGGVDAATAAEAVEGYIPRQRADAAPPAPGLKKGFFGKKEAPRKKATIKFADEAGGALEHHSDAAAAASSSSSAATPPPKGADKPAGDTAAASKILSAMAGEARKAGEEGKAVAAEAAAAAAAAASEGAAVIYLDLENAAPGDATGGAVGLDSEFARLRVEAPTVLEEGEGGACWEVGAGPGSQAGGVREGLSEIEVVSGNAGEEEEAAAAAAAAAAARPPVTSEERLRAAGYGAAPLLLPPQIAPPRRRRRGGGSKGKENNPAAAAPSAAATASRDEGSDVELDPPEDVGSDNSEGERNGLKYSDDDADDLFEEGGSSGVSSAASSDYGTSDDEDGTRETMRVWMGELKGGGGAVPGKAVLSPLGKLMLAVSEWCGSATAAFLRGDAAGTYEMPPRDAYQVQIESALANVLLQALGPAADRCKLKTDRNMIERAIFNLLRTFTLRAAVPDFGPAAPATWAAITMVAVSALCKAHLPFAEYRHLEGAEGQILLGAVAKDAGLGPEELRELVAIMVQ